MAGYDHYIDSNGVYWNIIPADEGFTIMATVLDDANPRYQPPAGDLMAQMDKGNLEIGPWKITTPDPITASQQVTLFEELRGKIEDFAHKVKKEHPGDVVFDVHVPIARQEQAGSGVALLVAMLIVVFAMD